MDATQVPLQALKPALQAKPQVVPLQVAVPFAGTAQGLHEFPHEVTLLLDGHMPAQLCVPVGQLPLHDDEERMHAPLHNFRPLGQRPSQRPFEQAAEPFAGTAQGTHDTPQLAVELLLAQVLPQTC